jgi:hypothetical protein
LKSLQNQKFDDFEIILVEHGSEKKYSDKLINFLRSNTLKPLFKDKIKFLDLEDNFGFTGGNNYAIKYCKGDIILLLNNDTFHEPNFLKEMAIFFENYSFIDIAQPKICFYPDKDIIWGMGGIINKYRIHLFNHLYYRKKDENDMIRPIRIDYAIGTALFVRREVLNEIGLLDNIYYMYCEESDLCYRAKLKGFDQVYCNPKAKIYHNYEDKISNSMKKWYIRNRIIFILKFFSFPLIILQFFLISIQIGIFVIDWNNKRIDFKFFKNSIKGLLSGLKFGLLRKYKS